MSDKFFKIITIITPEKTQKNTNPKFCVNSQVYLQLYKM